ncbi:hypothetical protein DSM19430T_12340 [Desulfovibrio psychrotolerans]|uniref:Uncharacterized protein n=1 Tax=Desulfovibrio psychrotolerans TaxID=415242 RepID=A0A7J0BSA0_9BACT|nr:hypothetical protein DSM19430T_12340 [Desulfovibrio psychrotolerans]
MPFRRPGTDRADRHRVGRLRFLWVEQPDIRKKRIMGKRAGIMYALAERCGYLAGADRAGTLRTEAVRPGAERSGSGEDVEAMQDVRST